jgi:hypothetical protein
MVRQADHHRSDGRQCSCHLDSRNQNVPGPRGACRLSTRQPTQAAPCAGRMQKLCRPHGDRSTLRRATGHPGLVPQPRPDHWPRPAARGYARRQPDRPDGLPAIHRSGADGAPPTAPGFGQPAHCTTTERRSTRAWSSPPAPWPLPCSAATMQAVTPAQVSAGSRITMSSWSQARAW